jgi:TRAP-type C4-dicarboxylate transport system substrate-binding protein
MMSAQVFDQLPAETQQILLEEAEIGGEIITALALDREQGFREKLQAAGVTFVDDVDRDALRDETRVVYEQFEEWTPGLYDTVQAAMKP